MMTPTCYWHDFDTLTMALKWHCYVDTISMTWTLMNAITTMIMWWHDGNNNLITLYWSRRCLIVDWLPYSYPYYNLLFLSCLLWSIYNKDSHEPLFISLVVNSLAILFEALMIRNLYRNQYYTQWFGLISL